MHCSGMMLIKAPGTTAFNGVDVCLEYCFLCAWHICIISRIGAEESFRGKNNRLDRGYVVMV